MASFQIAVASFVLDAFRALIGIDYLLVVSGGRLLAILSAREHSAEVEHSRQQIHTGLRWNRQIPAQERERSGVAELHTSVLVRARLKCKASAKSVVASFALGFRRVGVF